MKNFAKKWIVSVFFPTEEGLTDYIHSIRVGTRIKTERGYGTITGGSIQVELEHPYRAKNGAKNTGFSHNLDKLFVKSE